MFEVKFDLIQHTPLIHFKYNDLPIRATELKPQFDRFLMKVKNLDNEKEFKKNHRYKVFIEVENFSKEKIYFINAKNRKVLKTKLYFGGNDRFLIKNAKVKVFFRSFDKKLLDDIKKYFPYFISSYNFGMRKTKGYGSFTCDKFYKPERRVFKISVDIKKWEEYLNYFYKSLRSGINERGFYTKPLIFHYICKKNLNWEKKRIKEFLDDKGIKNSNAKHQINSCNNNHFVIAKDIFGLSTNQSWRGYKWDNLDINIKKTNASIDRYPSPIFFKPIKNNDKMDIYFWLWIDEKISNKRFTIKVTRGKNRDYKVDTLKVLDIDWDEFFDEFLLKATNYLKFDNSQIGKILNKVYSSLEEIK